MFIEIYWYKIRNAYSNQLDDQDLQTQKDGGFYL